MTTFARVIGRWCATWCCSGCGTPKRRRGMGFRFRRLN
jgi:hypothetical protein